ncbi:BnaC05g51880D [Brassica napus]|uniref:BnaC05g51880D protein n=1 Tax=Brassica napus TaxID=3708 RepID=A0A078ITM1_BRANA|nr:BnaC05g51880D [Brassica napus]
MIKHEILNIKCVKDNIALNLSSTHLSLDLSLSRIFVVQIHCLRPDPPSPSKSDISLQICRLRPDPRSRRDRDSKPQNRKSYLLISLFSLAKTGAVRVLTVSHGFVYEPYALHEKILWWQRCLYVTYGSLRSLYSIQELAGVSAAILNFLQRI